MPKSTNGWMDSLHMYIDGMLATVNSGLRGRVGSG